jgi:hypothetical protein
MSPNKIFANLWILLAVLNIIPWHAGTAMAANCQEPSAESVSPAQPTYKKVSLPAFGGVYRIPTHKRIVNLSNDRVTALSPAEATYLECLRRAGRQREQTGVDAWYLRRFNNPQSISLDNFIKDKVKLNYQSRRQHQLANGKFIVLSSGDSDAREAWFSPPRNPKLVVQMYITCDCEIRLNAFFKELQSIEFR